jgi:release factor glutamine methyltransferase
VSIVSPPTRAERLEAAVAELAAAGVAPARIEAEWLLAHVVGIGRFDVYLAPGELDDGQSRALDAVVRRRVAGEPLQQILGWESFRGLRMRVTRDVLVPRPETESLVDYALAWLRPAGRRIVDVGTGSGCIAAAIAHARPDAHVFAVDVSPAAVRAASENTRALGLEARVSVVVGDLLDAIGTGIDLVVANPPYLRTDEWPTLPREVRDWEPRLALDGGHDGLALLRRTVTGAARVLAPAGALVVETGGERHVDVVAALFGTCGYTDVAIAPDLTGRRRFVAGRWPGGSRAGGTACGRGPKPE